MDPSLLQTKLYIPQPRPILVSRPRLIHRLNGALQRKLTLISTPAGFGKTTLVSDWVRHLEWPRAWFSLDPADNDLVRFLSYLIAGLQLIRPEIGQRAQGLFQAAQVPRPETVLTMLINDMAGVPGQFVLVLDDYHVISEQPIHEAMDFLISRMPAHLHLVITTRSQPPLTLARLRGQAQLLEFHSADLRFTAVEVGTFLKDVMHLELLPADRTALEMRTEGWIAGLQLAALALQGPLSLPAQGSMSTLIADLSGTDRYIGDYLFEEVLRHQPDEVRHFLLFTSVADSLCGSLCDTILEGRGGQVMLERLDAQQLFIVPLDNQRQWYRYHHLFVDLLRHHFSQSYPDEVSVAHRRASLWFEQHDRIDDAIRHGLLAQDFERTADLIDNAFRQRNWVRRDMRRLLEWFDALPASVTRTRPNLELGVAWLLFEIYADPWDRIEAHLKQIDSTLTGPNPVRHFSAPDAQKMLASVDLLRANQARHAGEPDRVISLCQQAMDRLPDEELYLRSGVIAHLASAYERLGNLEQAGRLYLESIRMCRAGENIDGLLFATARVIEVLGAGGQLRQAEIAFGQARDYADTRTGPDMGRVYISIGEIYREQNRLDLAKTYLEKGLDLCRPFAAWGEGVTAGVMSLARMLMAEGHDDEALNTLREVEQQPTPATPLERANLESTRARLLLGQGSFHGAALWAKRSGLSVDDAPDFERESHHLTLARVLIAQAALEARGLHPLSVAADPIHGAIKLLDRLNGAAHAGGRMGRVIEIRVLQALTHALRQESAKTLQCVEHALRLAEAEGYVRLFVDEGRPVYQLLTLVVAKPAVSISRDHVETLLAAFPPSVSQSGQTDFLPGNTLTDRELKTLQLLATDLSIDEIASEITVSVSTVRTYAKRIYSKLDVHSRAEAVYRANELKLL